MRRIKRLTHRINGIKKGEFLKIGWRTDGPRLVLVTDFASDMVMKNAGQLP